MVNNESFIQKAFIRAIGIESVHNIITVTTSDCVSVVKDQYDEITKVTSNSIRKELIAEPCGRDTAAAIAVSAVHILNNYGPDEMMLILPSDHIILDSVAFSKPVLHAQSLAKQGKIVTFGIKPSYPEIGYGYIEYSNNEVFRFVEKPSFGCALDYLKSEKFLWNSGILCFTVSTIIKELETHCFDILSRVIKAINRSTSLSNSDYYKELLLSSLIWETIPEISIDYALLEKSSQIAVVACDIGWSDIGNWESMSRLEPMDKNGNRVKGNVHMYDTVDCYVESVSNKTIAVVGVKDLAIIESEHGFLVIDKKKASSANEIFANLQEKSTKPINAAP
jgi:mannose-1-phosphate guanylyltransferase